MFQRTQRTAIIVRFPSAPTVLVRVVPQSADHCLAMTVHTLRRLALVLSEPTDERDLGRRCIDQLRSRACPPHGSSMRRALFPARSQRLPCVVLWQKPHDDSIRNLHAGWKARLAELHESERLVSAAAA